MLWDTLTGKASEHGRHGTRSSHGHGEVVILEVMRSLLGGGQGLGVTSVVTGKAKGEASGWRRWKEVRSS